jgi:hypothetical protein
MIVLADASLRLAGDRPPPRLRSGMLFEYTSPKPEFRVSYPCVELLRELLVDGPGFGMVSFSGKIAFRHRAQAIIFEIICRHGDSPWRSGSIVMSLRCRIAQFGIGATILIPNFLMPTLECDNVNHLKANHATCVLQR